MIFMRTTLHIDDEVLVAAKGMARERGATLGQIISELARKSLPLEGSDVVRNGVRVFPRSGSVERPDLRTVNALRDEE